MFGRDAQLDDLEARLWNREHTCIWGPAGFGKTALAAEALLRVVGETEDTLRESPFPDGVVVLDLYRLKADQDQVWHLLADKFDPAIPPDLPAQERATRACKGRRALLVVEGAEEAYDGQRLRTLLAVLDPSTTQLITTRNKAQAYHPRPLRLDAELNEGDAIALLARLAENEVDNDTLTAVAKALGGHPLALTWGGRQLTLLDEPPARFLATMQNERLPALHESGYERHTLKWLYDRSVRMLTQDARCVLRGAGLLAMTPFGLEAARASLDRQEEAAGDQGEDRAHKALQLLVRHGLLRVATGEGERWEFSHALAARFARAEAKAACPPLEPLCEWALATLNEEAAHVPRTGEFSRLSNALLHATTLLAHDDSGDVGWQLSSWLLYEGQDLFFAIGRLASARESLSAVEVWIQSMPPARCAQSHWRREFSALLSRKGDVQLAQGDLAGARDSYQNSRAIDEKLAAGDPTNAQRQHDLGISNERLGDVLLAQGDLAGARDSYQNSHAIAEKLAAADPTNAQWQRDLSVSLNKLGNVQLAQGDLAGARHSYQNSRAIDEKLAAADPTNAQRQRDLSDSFEKLGDVQLAQGDLAGARGSYQNSHAIRGKLAARDPTNAQWQRDLVVSHAKLGQIAGRAGDRTLAREEFAAGLTIAERLCRLDPTNATWRRDAEWLRGQIGQ